MAGRNEESPQFPGQRGDSIELEGGEKAEVVVDVPEDFMEEVEGFVPMEEFWKNKGYQTHEELKKKGKPQWFIDFCSQIDDDTSGAFDEEETMVGIFWLLSLVPKGGTREQRKKNGGTTSDRNVMETLLALKAKFRIDFEEEQEELQKSGGGQRKRGLRRREETETEAASDAVIGTVVKIDEKEDKHDEAAREHSYHAGNVSASSDLKRDYKLFGSHLQLAIQVAVQKRIQEQKQKRSARQKRKSGDEKSPLLKTGLNAGEKQNAKVRIRHITRCVQQLLRDWKCAHILTTSETLKSFGKNAGIACVVPFLSLYDDGKQWREEVAECPKDDRRELCKLACLWLPWLILKGAVFIAYYYAMLFNVIYYHVLIYPFRDSTSIDTGEGLVTVSFMEAWMPFVFVVLVDFLFVHGASYSHLGEEEPKFSDYQRRMAMVKVESFDRRKAPSLLSIMTVCERFEATYKQESENFIEFPMLSFWKKLLSVILAGAYVFLPIAWRVASGYHPLGSDTSEKGMLFGKARERPPEAPVVVFNVLISFPALTLLLMELFVMNVDFSNQLKQLQALTAFTSSKTARKYEDCEEAFDNCCMELSGITNIHGFMVAREVIREDGVPEGSQRVIPPIILITAVYSAALIVKVILFSERGVTAFVVTATYLAIMFLLFLIFAILTVARSNTLMKEDHLKLLLETSKQFDRQMKDEIDRVTTARRLVEKRRQAIQRREDTSKDHDKENEGTSLANKQSAPKFQLHEGLFNTEIDTLKKEALLADRSSLETAIMEIQSLNEPIKFVGVEVDMALLFQVVAMVGAAAVSSALQFLGFD